MIHRIAMIWWLTPATPLTRMVWSLAATLSPLTNCRSPSPRCQPPMQPQPKSQPKCQPTMQPKVEPQLQPLSTIIHCRYNQSQPQQPPMQPHTQPKSQPQCQPDILNHNHTVPNTDAAKTTATMSQVQPHI